MPDIINPFDGGGFELADMTRAMNLLPAVSTVIGDLGIFRTETTTQFTILVEMQEGTLNLLPTVHRGGPATVGRRDLRNVRPFVVPHIPHNDVILPSDIQGIRAFGTANQAETLGNIMTQKLQRMRDRHSQTLEYMRLRAMQGVLKDGAGVTLANFYTEWGKSKKTVDFVLGTSGTDVPAKIREVRRYMANSLKGESMSGAVALVSPTFWDKFIKHSTIIEAYKYYTATTGANPMRDDARTGFTFHGLTFREYDETFSLFGGTTEPALADDYGVVIPLGTRDTFSTVFAPADIMEAVNTPGQEYYAWQNTRPDRKGIDLFTESNPFPFVRRPELVVEIHTSN